MTVGVGGGLVLSFRLFRPFKFQVFGMLRLFGGFETEGVARP